MPLPLAKLFSHAEISDWLSYDAITGLITWKKSRRYGIAPGDEAGMLLPTGYRVIVFKRKHLLSHHIAWLLTTGAWPIAEIDHRNCRRSENWFGNLREASCLENAHNRLIRVDNKVGLKGVNWHKGRQAFVAQIQINGKKRHLGYFATAEEAYIIYCKSASNNFGAFANRG